MAGRRRAVGMGLHGRKQSGWKRRLPTALTSMPTPLSSSDGARAALHGQQGRCPLHPVLLHPQKPLWPLNPDSVLSLLPMEEHPESGRVPRTSRWDMWPPHRACDQAVYCLVSVLLSRPLLRVTFDFQLVSQLPSHHKDRIPDSHSLKQAKFILAPASWVQGKTA